MNKYKEYINILAVSLTLAIILFYKFINGEYVFVSGDTLAPQAIKHAIASLIEKNGDFPYWFPYIFSGMPTVHSLLNINEFYFPHKIIKILHGFGLPWIWNFLIHYIFSAIGMYSLLRFLKQSKTSSIFSAILFTFSPYMIAYLVHGHGSQIMTAAYLPWIILFIFRIHRKNNIANFICLSLFVGLQLQRGHIQIAYYTWMFVGIFILISFIYNYKSNIKSACIKSSYAIGSLLMGFLLSLSIYYPVLNYTEYSVRGASSDGGYGIQNAMQWSLHIKEFFTFIIPYSYGFGGQSYWGFLPFTDFPNYIGIFIIFLAIIGLFKIKDEYRIFFIFALFLSLLLSIGKYFESFYTLFYNYLPFFNKFRAPIFILIIFQFSIYILAGFGIGALPNLLKKVQYRRRIFISCMGMLIILLSTSLYHSKLYPSHSFNGQETQFFDEVKKNYHKSLNNNDLNNDGAYNEEDINLLNEWTNSNAKLYYSYSRLIQLNKKDQDLEEILKLTNININNLEKNSNKDEIFLISMLLLLIFLIYIYSNYSFINKPTFLFIMIAILCYDYLRVNKDIIEPTHHIPNKKIVKHKTFIEKYLEEDQLISFLLSDSDKFRVLDLTGNNSSRLAAFNIETIMGYHAAKLSKYNQMLKIIGEKGYYPKGLLQVLNIKYIIHNKAGNIPNFSRIESKFKFNYYGNTFNQNGYIDSYIYQNNNFLNRMFFIENITFLDNENLILQNITNDSFNPQSNSYINLNDLSKNEISIIDQIKFNPEAKVEILNWEPDEIIFKTISDSPQILFFSEVYYPGWSINNKNILKLNGLFRGIIIDKGENKYIMKFKPKDIYIGNLISNIVYIFLVLVIFFSIYQKKVKNV